MKRFHWPLERLLKVTVQRELALRSELLALMHRTMRVRQEILARTAALRSLLSDLAGKSFQDRAALQEVFMATSARTERTIAGLREHVRELTVERGKKTADLITLRKSRDTMERMREEARQEHIREQLKLEQKEFDETAQIAFGRRLADPALSSEAGV